MSNVIAFPQSLARRPLMSREDMPAEALDRTWAMLSEYLHVSEPEACGAEIVLLSEARARFRPTPQAGSRSAAPDPQAVSLAGRGQGVALAALDARLPEDGTPAPLRSAEIIQLAAWRRH
jgi:hypothetical protein